MKPINEIIHCSHKGNDKKDIQAQNLNTWLHQDFWKWLWSKNCVLRYLWAERSKRSIWAINYWQLKECLGKCHHMFALFLYSSLGICFWPLSAGEHNIWWILDCSYVPFLCLKAAWRKQHTQKNHLPNVRQLIGTIRIHLRFSHSLLVNWFTFKNRVHLNALSKLTRKWPSHLFKGSFLIFRRIFHILWNIFQSYTGKLCLRLLAQMFNEGQEENSLAYNFIL